MRIGILGAGQLGGTLGRRLAAAGHQVVVAASRSADELATEVRGWGEGVRAAEPSDLAATDLVVLAFPWRERHQALKGLDLTGVLVIDATNPFDEDFSVIQTGPSGSTGAIAEMLPGARVVKALNTVTAELLAEPTDPGLAADDRLGVPIAGDDVDDKDTVVDLLADMGYAGVDIGTLADGARWMQPQQPLFMVPLTAAELRQRVAALRD